jgi:hypothetical protein
MMGCEAYWDQIVTIVQKNASASAQVTSTSQALSAIPVVHRFLS